MKITVFWFRRDLRLEDNAGLYHALKNSSQPVLPLFIFDSNILKDLTDTHDARVAFIHQSLAAIDAKLRKDGSGLLVKYGKPIEVWKQLLDEYEVKAAYTNRDYEPYARQRDEEVGQLLEKRGAKLHSYKDHVLMEAGEVLKDDGDPYIVFTPYKRKWMEIVISRKDNDGNLFYLKSYPTESYMDRFYHESVPEMPTLSDIGFKPAQVKIPGSDIDQDIIDHYDKNRDYPARNGTSRLGIHLRFGTLSIRHLACVAMDLNETFLSELVWRDFYSQILAFFPKVVDQPFRDKYANIPWRDADDDFDRWCNGQTGYPLVDAGMRQLNETGYMHNRVRMVTASFLTKHLLIDWRRGEAYFAEKLLDYDLASNNGGWQWAAGCGTDAAPYFRIFNPASQLKKFDPDHKYVRKWVPELEGFDYPEPMVEHKAARERCLKTFREALDS